MDHVEVDYGREAHAAAEEHIQACFEALADCDEYDASDDDDDMDVPTSPALAPFCGCLTCIVRETLYAAWPLVEKQVRELYGLPES